MIYTYRCHDCGKEFEEYCKTYTNHDKTSCKDCGGSATKIPSVPGGRYRYNDRK